jgi:hypothetical protein
MGRNSQSGKQATKAVDVILLAGLDQMNIGCYLKKIASYYLLIAKRLYFLLIDFQILLTSRF